MMSKFPRIARFFAMRYVNVGDQSVRNLASVSSNLCYMGINTRFSLLYPIQSRTWSKHIQNMQYGTDKSKRQPISDVNYSDIKDLPNHPEKLLVDVREPQELVDTGKIPTSINIPLDSVVKILADDVNPQRFQSKYGRRKPAVDDEIIFTCRLGKRALKAAEIASAMGFKNVKYYSGSWEDWVKNEKQ